MKLFKHESLWVGVIYFFILLVIVLWVRDIPNQPDQFITIQQLIEESEYNDPKSFATAAIDIAENGWISSDNDWIFNLWPPGFILLEAAVIKAVGSGAPVILILQILSVVLFSFVLVLLYELLSVLLQRKVIAFTLPLLLFAFPVSRVVLLEPMGIVLGEGFAVGFFLLSILLAFRAVARDSLLCAAYAGFCLALSAYFRSQFEFILLSLTAWGILLVIALQLIRFRKSIEQKLYKRVVLTITFILLVAHVATVPWRAYHWKYQESYSWVQSTDLLFRNSVATSEYLNKQSGNFIVEGRGNLVCRIDPTTCGDTTNAKKLFFKTFLAHPVQWYSLKVDVIGKYWFSTVQNWGRVTAESTPIDTATNGLLLAALLVLAALPFTRKVRSHGSWTLLIWFNASLFSAYLLIFTLVHFEVRYFYFPKIAGIFMATIAVCMYFRPTKKIDAMTEEFAK